MEQWSVLSRISVLNEPSQETRVLVLTSAQHFDRSFALSEEVWVLVPSELLRGRIKEKRTKPVSWRSAHPSSLGVTRHETIGT